MDLGFSKNVTRDVSRRGAAALVQGMTAVTLFRGARSGGGRGAAPGEPEQTYPGKNASQTGEAMFYQDRRCFGLMHKSRSAGASESYAACLNRFASLA